LTLIGNSSLQQFVETLDLDEDELALDRVDPRILRQLVEVNDVDPGSFQGIGTQ
jgi:hypothetical protein